MKPTNELFYLIKSLTKSEKRYFKLYSSLQSGEKNYLKLFDAIEKENTYDENIIKVKLKDAAFIKHFPSEKNHLYSQILKSLRMFHSESSISSILKELLQDIEILYNKTLYNECNKVVNRAKKISYEYEKFDYIFEILNWEKQLADEEQLFGDLETNLDQLNREEVENILKMRNLGEYQMLYSQINYVFRQGGYSRNEKEREIVERVSNHPLIVGKNTALSVRASTMCYYIKGLCAITNNDFDDTISFFLKVLEKMDKNPSIAKDLQKRRVKTFNYLLLAYNEAGQHENFFALIDTMKGFVEKEEYKNVDLKMKIFMSTSNSELLAYARMGDFEKGIKKLDSIVNGMAEFEGKINKESEILFYYNVAYLCFGAGEFNKALVWVNKLLNDNEAKVRHDICSFARILNLLIHFELQNIDLLEYITKSTQRYHIKHKRDYKFEMLILRYFKKMAKTADPEKRRILFKVIKSGLQEIVKDSNEKIALQYIDFISWLESKINQRSFAEIVKEKAVSKLL
ncbi:MAG: hypothetical protein H0V01_12225 [Bacteroidetes bacterium]|nr:hypothetical protein [Bacteroidota bacterium]HET6245826.1 hypothetical protein [Bacteroidia bacterium]